MMRVHPPVCHALPAPFPQLHMQIDDPQDSTAVHFCAGIVGTLLNGMFAKPSYVSSLEGAQCGGFIYTSQGGRQLGMQLLGGSPIQWCLKCHRGNSWTFVFAADPPPAPQLQALLSLSLPLVC